MSFGGMLARKYAILGQQAKSQRIESEANAELKRATAAALPQQQLMENQLKAAQANQIMTNTGLAPGLAEAEIGQKRASSNLDFIKGMLSVPESNARVDATKAGTAGTLLENQNKPTAYEEASRLSQARVQVNKANAGYLTDQSTQLQRGWMPNELVNLQTGRDLGLRPAPTQSTQTLGGASTNSLMGDDIYAPRRFAKGVTRVPGKSRTKDTTPALLAKDEAVLNAGAADKLGRGMIAKLNKAGAAKLGMV